eukprot:238953-Chlamydomonas_euryale.AAC.2
MACTTCRTSPLRLAPPDLLATPNELRAPHSEHSRAAVCWGGQLLPAGSEGSCMQQEARQSLLLRDPPAMV